MYFKEHPNLLRVSIPFFYFATTKTPVEIFSFYRMIRVVMSQLMFFDQGRKSFLRYQYMSCA